MPPSKLSKEELLCFECSLSGVELNKVFQPCHGYLEGYATDHWPTVFANAFHVDSERRKVSSDSILLWAAKAKKYQSLGDFLGDAEEQISLICAFGLVLLDRLAIAVRDSASQWEITDLVIELHECEHYACSVLGLTYTNVVQTKLRAMGGRRRAEKDPRTLAKGFVRDCWQEWRKHPNRYKNKSAFARDMLEKCDSLKSEKSITDWCRAWEKPAQKL